MQGAAVELAAVDLAVIAAYMAAVLAYGLWVGRGEADAEDYFLAGRALPWGLIGLSLYASNMSGASFVGLMGAAYEHGMVVFNYEWTATLVLAVLALFMLPAFLRGRLFTLPEYLERRFDRRSRLAFSGFTILAIMFVDTAGALYAGGVVIAALFPGVGLWLASAVLAAVAGVYTIFGGLRAVVVTDAVQALLVMLGAGLVVAVGLGEVGGWQGLARQLEPERLRLVKPLGDDFLPWPGLLGVILLGFYYWSLNQFVVQRVLGARALAAGQRGALFAGLLKLPNLALMIVPGLIAAALFPGLASPDQAFPKLAFELLPVGLRGIIVTALVAAIMSSLDSALNAAASLATMDFVRPFAPRLSGRALLRIGRLVTGVAMVVAAVYAPSIRDFGSLFEYFQATLSYLVPPVVAVYLGGLFCRRFTASGALAALVSGVAIGIPLFAAKEATGLWAAAGLPEVHFTLMSVIMCALALAVMTAVSLAAPPPAHADAERLAFRRADLAAAPGRRPWYADVRVQAAALLALTAAVIAVAW